MNNKRAFEILNNSNIFDVYYNNHSVWIQEIENDTAKIGFIDTNIEKNVSINDLYEK